MNNTYETANATSTGGWTKRMKMTPPTRFKAHYGPRFGDPLPGGDRARTLISEDGQVVKYQEQRYESSTWRTVAMMPIGRFEQEESRWNLGDPYRSLSHDLRQIFLGA